MLRDALENLKDGLQATMPTRVVTRDLLNFDLRPQAELEAGVLTVVTNLERGYANYRGREADLGKLSLLVVGQLKLPDDALPSEVEDAEFAFAEEVKDFLKGALPVQAADLVETQFSRQWEVPYGWFAMEWEVMP